MDYKDYGELLIGVGKILTEESTLINEKKHSVDLEVDLLFNLLAFHKSISLLNNKPPPDTLLKEHNTLIKLFEQLITLTEDSILTLNFNSYAEELRKHLLNFLLISNDIMRKSISFNEML